MTMEEPADLIRANSANTNRRIDRLRNDLHGQLMSIQNDLTDVRQTLSLVETVADMQRHIAALEAEVEVLKRRA